MISVPSEKLTWTALAFFSHLHKKGQQYDSSRLGMVGVSFLTGGKQAWGFSEPIERLECQLIIPQQQGELCWP